MFGKRRLLLISIAVLVVGSVTVALSSTPVPVIVGRALQGLAAGSPLSRPPSSPAAGSGPRPSDEYSHQRRA
jgi:MFS family permease